MCQSADSVSFVHTEERDETEAFLGAVWDTERHNPWITTLLVYGKPVEFKIDTGADVTVMPKRVFDSLPGDTLKPAKKILCGPSRRTLPVKGQFVATLKSKERETKEEVFVVKKLLLGCPAIEALGLVKRVEPIQAGTSNWVQQFPEVFQGLGKLEGEHKIRLSENARPFIDTTPHRVAIPLMPKVKAELERMENMGVIRRVNGVPVWW